MATPGPFLRTATSSGRSNREIAASLDIGDETVKTHVRACVELQLENRAQAMVQALKRGLVTLEELDGA